ncbi:MAG: AmmeMemoRadiSam system protein B [Elusimicrobiales bacterium]
MKSMTRPPAAAGSFYPARPRELEAAVKSFISGGEDSPGVKAILSPHAGYVYSGAAAGAAWAAVKNLDFETAVILGTGHRADIRGAALWGEGAFETPLGRVEIDGGLHRRLAELSPLFEVLPKAHDGEHSIEVQLPFLQCLGGKARKMLPLLLNTGDGEILEKLGRALAAALKGSKALLVISADLSHYPPAEVARLADNSLMFSLGVAARGAGPEYFGLAARLLMEKRLEGYDTACCGEAAARAGARAAMELGAGDFRLLRYDNSGDVKGADAQSTVGYGAGVFCAADGGAELFPLSEAERKDLLALARQSIARAFDKTIPPPPELSAHPAFNAPAAAFVTLHKRGELRGCIGSLEARQTLADCVAQMAKQSAFSDPRFPGLSRDELAAVDIEISVLSPMKRVKSAEEIIPGKHGVLIRKGARGGTYLPQVWEHFRSREEFMNSLCGEKAGLAPGAWKDSGAELYVYTAAVMAEQSLVK